MNGFLNRIPTGAHARLFLRRALLVAATGLNSLFAAAQQTVPQSVMQAIYDEAQTPYKYGMVMAPQRNDRKFDCPTVFRQGDRWFMTYVCYDGKGGTDGRGYETWIAQSDDLLHWTTLGRVLKLPETADDTLWDQNQRGGFPSLIDYRWDGSYALQAFKGNYWMTYIGGPGTGYEAVNAPLSIGLSSIKSADFLTKKAENGDFTVVPWETFSSPILSYNEQEAQWWEQLTQYKSTIYWMKDKKNRIKGIMVDGVELTIENLADSVNLTSAQYDLIVYRVLSVFVVLFGATANALVALLGNSYLLLRFTRCYDDIAHGKRELWPARPRRHAYLRKIGYVIGSFILIAIISLGVLYLLAFSLLRRT